MGKSRKSRKAARARNDPVGLDVHQTEEIHVNGNIKEVYDLDNICAQLQSVNPEDRNCGCNAVARLSLVSHQFVQEVTDTKVCRSLAPLLLDADPLVRVSACGALNNLSSTHPDTAEALVEQDVLTPLNKFLVTYYPVSWLPPPTTQASKQSKSDSDQLSSLREALGLLLNLVESCQTAVDVFNKENLLPLLISYLDLNKIPVGIVHSSLSVLASVSDQNPSTSQVILRHENQLMDFLSRNDVPALIKVTSSVTLVNSHQNGIFDHQVFPTLMSLVSESLGTDLLSMLRILSEESISNEEDTGMDDGSLDNNKHTKQVNDCKDTIRIIYESMELLVNLTSDFEEDSWEDEDELSDTDSQLDAGSDMDADISTSVPQIFIEAVKSLKIVSLVLNLANDLNSEAKSRLEKKLVGREVLSLFTNLRIRAFYCLTSLLDSLSLDELGDAEMIKSTWLNLGSLCVGDSSGGALAEAASSTLRSLTHSVCSLPSLASSVLGGLKKEDLASFTSFSHTPGEDDSELEANYIHIVGDIAALAANSLQDSRSQEIVSLSVSWLAERCGDPGTGVRTQAVAIDKLMDVLSGDESDELFFQMSLLAKFKHISAMFKKRYDGEKKTLAEHKPYIMDVKANFSRFIKYKEKRPLISR